MLPRYSPGPEIPGLCPGNWRGRRTLSLFLLSPFEGSRGRFSNGARARAPGQRLKKQQYSGAEPPGGYSVGQPHCSLAPLCSQNPCCPPLPCPARPSLPSLSFPQTQPQVLPGVQFHLMVMLYVSGAGVSASIYVCDELPPLWEQAGVENGE